MSIETSAKTALTPSKKSQNFISYSSNNSAVRSPDNNGTILQNQLKASPKLNEKSQVSRNNLFGVDEKKIVTKTINLALDDETKNDQEVTAIHSYKGKSDEHELSFDYGDKMRIIKIVAKDPQWALAELRGKQGYIALNYVKSKSITMPWYHGNLTREQAEFLLKDTSEGSYLMRESTHYPGDFTLCLKSESKVENYHIKQMNNRFTIDDENMFKNLIELVDFYTKFDDLACKLNRPIAYRKKQDSSDYQTLLNSLWIDNIDVKVGREIGIGEFGAVFRGSFKNNDVAIKKIKDKKTANEFLKEAFCMASLSHPNLVKLIGVVRHLGDKEENNEISLVTEYMPKGSLLDYLMSRGRNVLTSKELIDFVINICDGMSYLEEKGIVHRDLAASNVLISKDDIAKVSDFGLSKKIMDDTRNGVRIRIKWSAPEAIKDRLYSNKSDMWSFGILLWEIFSYGRVPYPKIPVNEVLTYIEQGYQMEKPDGCPDEIYALMKEAWEFDRTLRPTFSNTVSKLAIIKTKILESL